MNYPRISIVTPSFNQGEYLEETIHSVLEQNYPNLQYIIIDGGSSDQSVSIIKKYEKYIDFWVSEKDKGQSDAINKGFLRCDGHIFNWLCSDDYYEKDTLDAVAKCYVEQNAKVICGDIRYINNESSHNKVYKGTQYYPEVSKCIGNSINIQPSTFFDKERLDKIFPLNTSLHYAMDQEFWIRYLLSYGNKNITSIDKVLTNFRIHENSKTSKSYNNFKQDEYRIFSALATLINATLEMQVLNNYYPNLTKIDFEGIENNLKNEEVLEGIKYFLMNRNDSTFFRHNIKYCLSNYRYCNVKRLILNSKIIKKIIGTPNTL